VCVYIYTFIYVQLLSRAIRSEAQKLEGHLRAAIGAVRPVVHIGQKVD